MGDDIGWGLWSMDICFDIQSTSIVQLSNQNLYFHQCHDLLMTQLSLQGSLKDTILLFL